VTTAAPDQAPAEGHVAVNDRTDGQGASMAPKAATPVRRRGHLSYQASLILWLSTLVLGTGLAISLISFRGARASAEGLADGLFHEVSDHAVNRTRMFLHRAMPIAQGLGDLSSLGLSMDDHQMLARQLFVVLRANTGVSWISYSSRDGAFVGVYRTPPANCGSTTATSMPRGARRSPSMR
jgi:hypothetical protein